MDLLAVSVNAWLFNHHLEERSCSSKISMIRGDFALPLNREENQAELLDMSPVSKNNVIAYKAWAMKFAKWLYSTDHIEIIYSVDYEGVSIQKLSPGTRGIVLLLLYLALDNLDDRPLIIDQPEENLDPKSIYDELVSLFIDAKGKRQVILVTHNANLVVNTDADQIIIASSGERDPLVPEISYKSGSLKKNIFAKKFVIF